MRFWKSGIWMIVMVVFLCPVAAVAAERGSHPGRWWSMPELAGKLDLTEQERRTLDDLFTKERKALFDLRNEVEKERMRLDEILEKPNLDEKAALRQFDRVEQKRQKLGQERFRYLLEVRKVLGQERYLKLMAMARENRGKRERPQADPLFPR